jgi:hypothetical protein
MGEEREVTNVQLYLAIGAPMVFAALNTAILILYMNGQFSSQRDLWRAELRRVEEVLDARLKHIEERR